MFVKWVYKKSRLLTILFAIMSVLQIAFIFSNSLFDRQQSLQQSGFVGDLMQRIVNLLTANFNLYVEITSHFTRKLAHFTEYSLLGFLIFCLFFFIILISTPYNEKNYIFYFKIIGRLKIFKTMFFNILFYSCVFCLLIACVDETLQYFSGRAPMLSDVLLDFCGSLFGILIALLLIKLTNICMIIERK